MGKTPSGQEETGTDPPLKQAKCLKSAAATQNEQISSLTAQNQKMIPALATSGIDIPGADPSLSKDDGEDRKMAANKTNLNLTETNERKK